MTPLDRAIAAINNTASVQDVAGDQQGVVGARPLHVVTNPEEVARAVLQAIREPSSEMCGEAHDTLLYAVKGEEMDVARAVWGRMMDAALEEG